MVFPKKYWIKMYTYCSIKNSLLVCSLKINIHKRNMCLAYHLLVIHIRFFKDDNLKKIITNAIQIVKHLMLKKISFQRQILQVNITDLLKVFVKGTKPTKQHLTIEHLLRNSYLHIQRFL